MATATTAAATSAPKPDVRVKMLQNEVSVLQRTIADMERDNRQSIQRMQRTLEMSWRKELKAAQDEMQRQAAQQQESPSNTQTASKTAVSPVTATSSSACEGVVKSTDSWRWNMQIQSISRQVEALEAKFGKQGATAKSPSNTDVVEGPALALKEQIDVAVQTALEKYRGDVADPVASSTEVVAIDANQANDQVDTLLRKMEQQSQELDQLRQQIVQQRQQQAAQVSSAENEVGLVNLMSDAESRVSSELAGIKEEMHRLETSLQQTSSQLANATEAGKTARLGMKQSVIDLKRDLLVEMDKKFAMLQGELIEAKSNLQVGLRDSTRSSVQSSADVTTSIDNMRRELDGAKQENASLISSEMAAIKEEMLRLQWALELTSSQLNSTTESEKTARLGVQQGVEDLQRDLLAQIDSKFSALQGEISDSNLRQADLLDNTRAKAEVSAEVTAAVESMRKELEIVKQEHLDMARVVERLQAEEAARSKSSEDATTSDHVKQADWERRTNEFWTKAAKLEEHLAQQFAHQERQMQLVRDLSSGKPVVEASNRSSDDMDKRTQSWDEKLADLIYGAPNREAEGGLNEDLDQRILSWDEQLADLIHFVEQTVEEQEAAFHDVQCVVQTIQGQQTTLQQKFDAVTDSWDKKHAELSQSSMQAPIADERQAHDDLRSQIREEFNQELSQWKQEADKVNVTVKETIQALQQDHSEVSTHHENMMQQCDQYQKECHRLRKEKRRATQLRTANLEKRKEQLRTLLLADGGEDGSTDMNGDGVELVYQTTKGVAAKSGIAADIDTVSSWEDDNDGLDISEGEESTCGNKDTRDDGSQ